MQFVVANNTGAPVNTQTKAEVEADLDAYFFSLGYVDFQATIQRNDGAVYEYNQGTHVSGHRLPWKSTTKLINNVIALHQVSKGRLGLNDKITSIVPSFSSANFGDDIEVIHAMDFITGITSGDALNNFTDLTTWNTAVRDYPLTSTNKGAPGLDTSFQYGNFNLDLMGLAVIHATRWDAAANGGAGAVVAATSPTDPLPFADWNQIAQDFAADTGLLANIEFVDFEIISNAKKLSALQYMDLIYALRNKTILTQASDLPGESALCDLVFSPRTADTYTAGDGGAADWGVSSNALRYGSGVWQYQNNGGTWQPATTVTQFTTIGVLGDNAWIDPDFVYVNSTPYDGTAFASLQIDIFKNIESTIRLWTTK